MSSLVVAKSEFDLTAERLNQVLFEIEQKIKGRVQQAFVFGSAAAGAIHKASDIDLIFVVAGTSAPFPERAFEFIDLFTIFPRLDILVYTPEELACQLEDSSVGFWKSVRESMRPLRTADHMPPHVHVTKAECHAKIAIESLEVLEVDGFSEKDVNRIVAELKKRQSKLLEKWNEIQKDQLR